MANTEEVSKGLTPLVVAILHSNLGVNYSEEDKRRMVKSMRLCLRLDYEMKASDVHKLNDYEVIQKWYEFHLEEGIGGA